MRRHTPSPPSAASSTDKESQQRFRGTGNKNIRHGRDKIANSRTEDEEPAQARTTTTTPQEQQLTPWMCYKKNIWQAGTHQTTNIQSKIKNEPDIFLAKRPPLPPPPSLYSKTTAFHFCFRTTFAKALSGPRETSTSTPAQTEPQAGAIFVAFSLLSFENLTWFLNSYLLRRSINQLHHNLHNTWNHVTREKHTSCSSLSSLSQP